jgi:hypothetical protein
MYSTAFCLLLAIHGHGREVLPSQHLGAYYYGCTPANRHCERCRADGWGPYYDYRRHFDYPWYPPYHRPVAGEIVPYDLGPRIVPLSDFLPGQPHNGQPWEEVPPPENLPSPEGQSSPSDRPPPGK